MTPEQRRVARHALGLPNDRRRSYRNRFFASSFNPNFRTWSAMVSSGDAIATPEPQEKLTCFELTRQGAEAALDPGETLDPEDFPAERTEP